MSEIRKQTEALLEAMGWEPHKYGTWMTETPDGMRYATPGDPSLGWVFEHLIPWATGRGWELGLRRPASANGEASIYAFVEDGSDPFLDPLGEAEVYWKPGEPDRTVEAIVSALYAALTGESDGC